ncbi:hypothetical protein CDD83_439 [Cordyceps sp. RAO-2017]|nr:hypothetical protein CDD83_439 [Cordyceps sp. RAO-2017]
MEQQKQGQNDADALPPSGIDGTQHAGAMPPFGHDLLSQPNPEAVAAIMAGQPFLPDPSLAGMPVGGANDFLLPAMMANGSAPVPLQARNKAVSADDVALYDRQIRLWGMAAQARIQNASALIITMRALANEVAKNLALAGIGSLTLLDGAAVTEADLGAQFLLACGSTPRA